MSKPTWTPGPWEAIGDCIYDQDGLCIAVSKKPDYDIAESNARLIATVTELYDMLTRLLIIDEATLPEIAEIKVLLAKARGEEPPR